MAWWMYLAMGAAVFLAGFGSGWKTSDWKNDSEDKVVLISDVAEREARIGELTRDLQLVIEKASDTAEAANERLDAINGVITERNRGLELLTRRTEELGNEIEKLGEPTCVFAPSYRGMFRQISEEANGSRDRLFNPAGNPAN